MGFEPRNNPYQNDDGSLIPGLEDAFFLFAEIEFYRYLDSLSPAERKKAEEKQKNWQEHMQG